MDRWSDADWTGHRPLLQALRAAGLQPRVEHIAREDFPARWDSAAAAKKVPDLISADNLAGLIKSLEGQGRLAFCRLPLRLRRNCPAAPSPIIIGVAGSWMPARSNSAATKPSRWPRSRCGFMAST